MSPTFDPIAPWPLLAVASLVVLGLSWWTYRRKLTGGGSGWRWAALGLRVAALLLCLLACLKPTLLVTRKVKQTVGLAFLLDNSESMGITDEANNRSRSEAARETLETGMGVFSKGDKKLELASYLFDEQLREMKSGAAEDKKQEPAGVATAIGTALDEVMKRSSQIRLLAVVLLSDGASNSGIPPEIAAQRMRSLGVPLLAVGLGSESAGAASRDLVARDLTIGPAVFVKNQPGIRATVEARGYPGQEVLVELFEEDQKVPAARKTLALKGPEEVISITDLKWIPQRAGETKVTMKVTPKEGELVSTNNEISTYVTVQSGGLAVLYLQGPNFSWEYKYLTRALDAAQEIQATLRVIRRPVTEDPAALPEDELAPGKYDVVILADIPADYLSRVQRSLLKRAVERGAGLMVLGGRSSFGAGGWTGTEVAEILPTEISARDGQIEPESGLKIVPETASLENYLLRLGPGAQESARLWDALPKLSGANRLGPVKRSAFILARTESPTGEPLMVAHDVAGGRVLAFGGETWPWARFSEETQAAHRKFWRQAILWLAHKEDEGTEEVKLALDRRRLPTGQRLELRATARNAQGEPIADVRYEASVEPATPAPDAGSPAEPVDLFNQEDEGRGTYFATGKAGEYRAKVKAFRGAQLIGEDSARFLVFQENRELENPAADLSLLRQLTELTGGRLLPPERLEKELKALDTESLTETQVQREVRLWDNWPFLLIFVGLLTTEWWLRKRLGWA